MYAVPEHFYGPQGDPYDLNPHVHHILGNLVTYNSYMQQCCRYYMKHQRNKCCM